MFYWWASVRAQKLNYRTAQFFWPIKSRRSSNFNFMIALKWRDAWKQQGHAGQWMWSMRPDTYAQSKCPAHIKIALVGFNLVTIHKSTFTYFCCWIQNRPSLLKTFCNKWSWIKVQHFLFKNQGNMHSQLYTSRWHSIVTTRSFIWKCS